MRTRSKLTEDANLPLPAELPPIEGLEAEASEPNRRPLRTWLWTLIAALVVVLIGVYVLVLGGKAIYDGLRDRALENQSIAREHYALGLAYLEEDEYELAVAEFELALTHDSGLLDARTNLRKAKELALAEVTPTSETRLEAVRSLYSEGVAYYESGNLLEAVAALEELRGLDAEYQLENMQTMLANAHHQLGLNAVTEDRLEDAIAHFNAVLALRPGDEAAQDQLNLADVYRAALNYWERDWPATIQALKGLLALAPDYKDVRVRLRDAYLFYAESLASKGDWCQAANQFAGAVEIMPLESTVDRRDDAEIRCQATVEAPSPTPTARTTAPPPSTTQTTPSTTASVQATPQLEASSTPIGQGQIIFTGFDAVRQRHDLYIVDLAQRDASLLRANAGQPALGPARKKLAFRNFDPFHLGLGVLDLGSNTFSELTDHAEDSMPVWSPDGQQIVFASDKHGDRKWRLYVISPFEIRGEGEEWVFGQKPAWSPDGGRIAYHGCDEQGNRCAVWVMQPGGFNPAQLTTDASDNAPAWSPDGTQVAFASARTGNWEIFVIDIATGQETRLTNHTALDLAPAWSPDGRELAFLSDRDGAWAVHILDLRTGQVRQVIATGEPYPDPFIERLYWMP
jgi:tetratricopeptide (TPR) repeat protein